jgi:hypothetical protein
MRIAMVLGSEKTNPIKPNFGLLGWQDEAFFIDLWGWIVRLITSKRLSRRSLLIENPES